MKTKLFENVGGNKFKLLTEAMNPDRAKSIRDGLKKVFSNTTKEVSYDKVQNFGLGFIKDVTEARKCALQEARDIAPALGFADHPETGTFVKEADDVGRYEDALDGRGDTGFGDEEPSNSSVMDPAKEKRIRAEMRKLFSHTFQEPLLSKAIDDAIQAIKGVKNPQIKEADEQNEETSDSPEEKREVAIGKEILSQVRMMTPPGNVAAITKLASELIKMHQKNKPEPDYSHPSMSMDGR